MFAFALRFFLVVLLACVLSPLGYGQEEKQSSCTLCLPTPPELFAAMAKEEKVRWRGFYRVPVVPQRADRYGAAFALGGVITDVYIAAEARDSQQVRNVSQDLSAELGGLGLDEKLAIRVQAISTFADAEEWGAIRFELEATTNEIWQHLHSQLDSDLGILMEVGMTMRALMVCIEAVPEEDGVSLDFVSELASHLTESLAGKVYLISSSGQVQPFVRDVKQCLLRAIDEAEVAGEARKQLGVFHREFEMAIERIKGEEAP